MRSPICLAVVAALSSGIHVLRAQGITSAAVEGRVVLADLTPAHGATVRLTSPASGAYWQVMTDAAGRYFLENVEPGGPYGLEVRRVGFIPARRGGIVLALGQRHRVDVVLEPLIIGLREVNVTAGADPLVHSGRTGPEHIVSESELGDLPNLARDLNVAVSTAPLATARPLGGISIGGQNQGFNGLQIDGGVNGDLYLGRSPGGASPSGALPEVLPRAIAIETVKEIQVLAAPFDVRFGNFAGGLLNAVTRSGTNDTQGSLFGFAQSGHLVGKDAAGRRPDFTTWQFGGSLSGPVSRDRVHYFVNLDLQRRVVPDPGPVFAESGRPGVRESDALRFRQILEDRHGLEGGSLTSTGYLPARDLFVKVTAQLGATGRLELSQHHASAERRGFVDVGRTRDSIALGSVAGTSRSTAHTTRLIWSTLLRDRAQGELILSVQRLRDSCRPEATFPLVQVRVGSSTLMAGPNSVCPTTDVRQQALEATGNLTIGMGHHLVTVGSHVQLLHFRDPLVQVSAGRWDFDSLAALDSGRARHYDRGLPAPPPRSPGADFRVRGLGIYVQDRWSPTARLTLTLGMRLDAAILPDAATTNPALLARGIDTGRLPRGVPMLSPRLGINHDIRGDGTAFLRGGIGVFAGAPPYRWLGNGYRDSGDEMVVSCDGPAVPVFTPHDQPASCATPGGTSRRISFFDRSFRYPQNLKAALGMDRRLPGGTVATIDLLYTRAIRQVFIGQANLGAPRDTVHREGGRLLYGTIGAGGLASPAWLATSSQEREIYRLSSASGDHALSLSIQAGKQLAPALGVRAAYTHSRVRDRMSMVNFPARANFSNTPLDGSLDDRRLRPSFFETPHKVSLVATLGRANRSQLTLLYVGASQPPFTYVVNGDANADGIGGAGSLKNDIVYVPRDSTDISLATPSDYARLDAFVERHRCLREQRGRIMSRGSCRNGWLDLLNARVTTTLPGGATGSRFEITTDVVNLPNLINPRWGRQLDVTSGPSVMLLTLDGWDATRERPRYRVPGILPAEGVVHDASRWRVQVGAKYFLR